MFFKIIFALYCKSVLEKFTEAATSNYLMLLISFFPKIVMLKCCNLFLGICLKGIVKTLEHCNDLLQ